MNVATFAWFVAGIALFIVATGVVAAIKQRRVRPGAFCAVSVLFALSLVGVYWIARGVHEAVNAALAVMDAGSMVATTLRDIDANSNCAVPTAFIAGAQSYTHNVKGTIEAVERSAVWTIWVFFGSFVGSVLFAAMFRSCWCCSNLSAVVPIALSGIAAVVVAAGSVAVCTAYIDETALSPDLEYLVNPNAPAPLHKLLPVHQIEELRAICSDTALAPLDRFTKAGAFSAVYGDVVAGVCVDARDGAIAVAAISWLSLVALIVVAVSDDKMDKNGDSSET